MEQPITKTEALAFKARWAAVNAAERVELRSISVEQKGKQLNALMLSVESMGWAGALAADEALVWQRWRTLRERLKRG